MGPWTVPPFASGILPLALISGLAACSTGETDQTGAAPAQSDQSLQEEMRRNEADALHLAQRCNVVFANLHIGMRETSVQNEQPGDPGFPRGVCATIHFTKTAYGFHDQWVWGDGSGRYVYFDKGILTAIQN